MRLLTGLLYELLILKTTELPIGYFADSVNWSVLVIPRVDELLYHILSFHYASQFQNRIRLLFCLKFGNCGYREYIGCPLRESFHLSICWKCVESKHSIFCGMARFHMIKYGKKNVLSLKNGCIIDKKWWCKVLIILMICTRFIYYCTSLGVDRGSTCVKQAILIRYLNLNISIILRHGFKLAIRQSLYLLVTQRRWEIVIHPSDAVIIRHVFYCQISRLWWNE